ncbi:MAG: hypothetical protein KatS3mg125_0009 [Lysobacterales bacterium]|jgi:hypothetical protein|nr:MAG: hypothetical protein KatS3mg125_0009 [Xanthomonadales bacterium]
MATSPTDDLQTRRAAARRTALALGLVALAVYLAFLLRGIFGGGS